MPSTQPLASRDWHLWHHNLPPLGKREKAKALLSSGVPPEDSTLRKTQREQSGLGTLTPTPPYQTQESLSEPGQEHPPREDPLADC